jgi:hypothetical protein
MSLAHHLLLLFLYSLLTFLDVAAAGSNTWKGLANCKHLSLVCSDCAMLSHLGCGLVGTLYMPLFLWAQDQARRVARFLFHTMHPLLAQGSNRVVQYGGEYQSLHDEFLLRLLGNPECQK